jgi:molecular chaperone GrpE
MSEGPEQPVVRDRRRIDPVTGEVRAAEATPPGPGDAADPGSALAGELAGDVAAAEALIAELDDARAKESVLLDDLRRLQAEYANYRKRVERDRDVARDSAVAGVLEQLLPVLDDVGRARDHGDLDGAFRTVGEALEAVAQRLGLERYGADGDPFDPAVHEALMHRTDPEATAAVCEQVLFPGYRYKERLLRAARVSVVEPGD